MAEKNSDGDLCNMPTSLLLARDIDSGLHLLSCDNMKNTLRDVVFLYAAKSRQEEKKLLPVIGQLLEPIDLGCQSGSVVIVLARHFDQIYTTCVLFIRPSVLR